MPDIIDEILNDVKDENRLRFFRAALPVIIFLTIIIAIFITIYNMNNSKKIDYNTAIGDKFLEITHNLNDQVDNNIITKLGNLLKDTNNTQQELMELKIATELIFAQKSDNAIEKLGAIINNENYNNISTAFARLLLVSLLLDQDINSTSHQKQILDHLQYFDKQDKPFFAVATLIKALFHKMNSQNNLAVKYSKDILNLQDAPFIMKEQAKAILSSTELD